VALAPSRGGPPPAIATSSATTAGVGVSQHRVHGGHSTGPSERPPPPPWANDTVPEPAEPGPGADPLVAAGEDRGAQRSTCLGRWIVQCRRGRAVAGDTGTGTRWRGRFVSNRLQGLVDEPRPGRAAVDPVGSGRTRCGRHAGAEPAERDALAMDLDGHPQRALALDDQGDLAPQVELKPHVSWWHPHVSNELELEALVRRATTDLTDGRAGGFNRSVARSSRRP
jgi:hypothetical protein